MWATLGSAGREGGAPGGALAGEREVQTAPICRYGPLAVPRDTRALAHTRAPDAQGRSAHVRSRGRACEHAQVRAPLARYRYTLVQRHTAPYAPPRGSAPCTHATSDDSARRRARGATECGMTLRRMRGTAAVRGATPHRYARGAVGVGIAHMACFYRTARASEHPRPRAVARRMRACVGDPRQRGSRGRRDWVRARGRERGATAPMARCRYSRVFTV